MENNKHNRDIIVDNVKRVANEVSNIRDTLCIPYGISSIQSIIILDIYHNPNECKVTDICRRLYKSTNTISPLINRLVSKGFLEKQKSPVDSRVTNVCLTDKTKEIVESFNRDLTDYVWPMFDKITDEEFNKIYEALELLAGVVK